MAGGGSRRTAFTLIELLVVVAIIALLIAILLPSLSEARKQARTTLCGTRISQLAKAIFLYAEDFDETPPFLGTGYENVGHLDRHTYYDGHTGEYWAWLEDWIMPNMPAYWCSDSSAWPNYARVREGSLFAYARFEEIYLCPEFARAGIGEKSQNVFNYTRTVLGRKAYAPAAFPQDPPSGEPLMAGPVMKPSNIHSPGKLWMLFDEQWDFHCAAPAETLGGHCGEGLPAGELYNFWMVIDPIQSIAGDMLGSYHGPEGKALPFDAISTSMSGSLAMYDGHVELYRDPLPFRAADMSAADVWQAIEPALTTMGDLLIEQIFSQRGADMQLEDIAAVFIP